MKGAVIEDILRQKCGKHFIGIFPRDRLPASLPPYRPLLIVCNTDPHYKPGQHWIALYIGTRGRGKYFDSFGIYPPLIFSSFFNKNCSEWIYNSKRIQSVVSTFCGQFCIFYCLYKQLGYELKDIVACFHTEDTALNDVIANTFFSLIV